VGGLVGEGRCVAALMAAAKETLQRTAPKKTNIRKMTAVFEIAILPTMQRR